MNTLWNRSLYPRLGMALALSLGLGACAQIVQVSPQQSASDAVAVQAGRERILALSPAVNTRQLAPVQKALSAAREAVARGDYVYADRQTLLAKVLLDNIQIRLNASTSSGQRAMLKSQIGNLQSQIASTRQQIDVTKAQIAKEAQ
ncbi:hypothetical protein [Acidithiobacillus sp.]|uniref:hypothetical protein n=1 Tax=Acidithiobacillus sp. TaxID=1872118 RepID=UPI0025C61B3E|nr:hypothetical protein [Acidithiobacillus sp.]MCK9188738.1 hypothetical protein [Acidithiobacillus sp.]MCK9359720.1 hypothetical protein [Acidithiobacillus sp.]